MSPSRALTSTAPGDLQVFASEVRRRANAQYTTRHHQRLYNLPLTIERYRAWDLQIGLWALNRRDCWGFAQGLAPFDVKQLIWHHEQDELSGNKERGVENHFALQVREGELFGLTRDDFANVEMYIGTRAVTYAWIHLVKDSHWLKSVAACAALEVSNSAEWVEGGGTAYRRGKRAESQLGIPFEKQISNKEHAEVDVEHANMLMEVARRHGTTQAALDMMMEGVIETWELETVWKGQVADMMEAIPIP